MRETYQRLGEWSLSVTGCRIILRGLWCNIIVLNVHAPCEDKGDDVKDSFCVEVGRGFDQVLRYDTNILLGDFSA
jgi:hypothetical protein